MSFNSPFTGTTIQPTDVSYRSVTLSDDTQLQWPINGNATDDYAARIMQVTATTSGLSLWMPPANQTSVGNDALIRNTGANSFTVKTYDGLSTIITIAAGETKYIYITANPDEQGTWGTIAFGVGTSAVDAATLQGYGLTALSSTLNTAHPVTTFSSNYTAVAADRAQTLVWNGGAGTLTLTLAVTLGNNWFVLVRNGGTGTLAIDPTGPELINGSSSIDLQPSDSAIICCSGSAFFTVGIGRSALFNFSQNTKAVVTGSYSISASEASSPIQKFTGTLTGAVTVTIPQTVSVYYITNQTDGTGAGYTITFTTGAAGSQTAVVPAGQQVILLCDSQNIYNASTVAAGAVNIALANGTGSSPSLNFSAETTTGLYRPGAGEIGFTVLGTKRAGLTATGWDVIGTGTFSGGVAGGAF